ncbi:MAG: hypothetical protein J5379_02500 [Clostridiales bacterium]|nr:hypothetical protein [Clostridiales bacterium]
MKKKIGAVLMALALSVSVCACSKEKETEKEKEKTKKTTAEETEEDPTEESTEDTTEVTTEESTEETTTETTKETTEETTEETQDAGQKKQKPATVGVDEVKKDLEKEGFQITDDLKSVSVKQFQEASSGFSASNDKEFYCYCVFDTEDQVLAIEEEGLPMPADGKTRISMGDVTWLYVSEDGQNDFQYMVLNPTTKKVLYYTGPEDKGARSNAYAIELGIFTRENGWASFEEDPNYPDGEGLTKESSASVDVELKNEKAKALMDDMVSEGVMILPLPMEGVSVNDVDGEGVGFMAMGGAGKYEDIAALIYMEYDLATLKTSLEDLEAQASEIPGVEIVDKDGVKYVSAEEQGTCIYIVADTNTGIMYEYMGSSMENGKAMAAKIGYEG